MEVEFEILDMNTPEGRAKVALYKREKAERISCGQQIYARIKKSSKYYGQTAPGDLFPVYVEATGYREGYVVQGGPGGQYRLQDVNLYVVENEHEMRIC